MEIFVNVLLKKSLTVATLLSVVFCMSGFSGCSKNCAEGSCAKKETKVKKTVSVKSGKSEKKSSKNKKGNSSKHEDLDGDSNIDDVAFLDNLSTEKALRAQQEIARLIAMIEEENRSLSKEQELAEQPYQTVLFEPGSSQLDEEQHFLVGENAQKISEAVKAGRTVIVRGHSDSIESNYSDAEAFNLAQMRAETVKNEFVKAGIPEASVEVASIGKEEPIVYNFDKEQQERSLPNRRVEILTI
jgi:outer membrane protein OmpA-like peptidoglycan-associated protein